MVSRNHKKKLMLAAALVGSANSALFATDGTWTRNSATDTSMYWSNVNSWLDQAIADGNGAVANFLTTLTDNRTVRMDSNRTLGVMNIGAASGDNWTFTTAVSSGLLLTLDNTALSANAQINKTQGGADDIRIGLLLNSSLDISNNDDSLLSFTTNPINASTAGLTITNKGTGVGAVSITSVLGSSLGVTQDSSTSVLFLAAANTFSGPVNINNGILQVIGAGVADTSGGLGIGNTTVASGGELRTSSTNAYLGSAGINLAGGTLRGLNAATINYGGSIVVSADSTIVNERSVAGGSISNTYGSLSLGAATVELTGASTFTAGAPVIIFGSTTLTGDGTLNVTNGSAQTTEVRPGALSDNGVAHTLTKSGPGTLTLNTAANSLTSGGGLVLTGGATNQTTSGALGTGQWSLSLRSAGGATNYTLSNSQTQTVSSIGFSGSSGATNVLATGSGTITTTGGITYDAANNPGDATLSGRLALTPGAHTFDIGSSSNASAAELTVSARVSNADTAAGITKTGAGTLFLSNEDSTYSGGVWIKGGTVVTGGSSSASKGPLGVKAAQVILGDTAGSNSATLLITAGGGVGTLLDNSITLGGSTGVLSIGSTGNGTSRIFSPISIGSNNLTLTSNQAAILRVGSGGITGTGNLILAATGAGPNAINFDGTVIDITGTITNNGTGTGTVNIQNTSGTAIGTNVSSIIQDSETSRLVIGGTQNSTGTIYIKAGILEISFGNRLTTGTLTIGNNGAPNSSTAAAQLDYGYTGTGDSSSATNIVIGGGTTGHISIVNPSNGNLTLSGLLTLGNNLTLSSNGSKRLSLTGAITGNKTITIDNQAAIDETNTKLTALAGNNTDFTGNVVIRAGHGTALVSGNAFGSGVITLGAVDGTADAKLSAGNDVTVANAINVIGGNSVNHYLGNLGNGNTGATFTGLVTLGQGSSAPTNVIIDGLASASGILTFAGGIAGHGDVQISSRGTSSAVHSISAGDGSKTINNVGLINMLEASTKNFTLSAPIGSNVTGIVQNATEGGKLVLSGANVNFVADTTINSGAIIINNDAALTKSTVNNDGGTVEYLVANATFGGLKGDTDVATPTGTLSIGNNNNPSNFSGGLTGTGAVTKVGTGTQTLSGANSYTGATSVAAGTLLVNGTNSATGNYGVAAGAVLGGSGTIAAAVSQNPNVAVVAGAKLAPGGSAGATGTLTLNLGDTGTLDLTGSLGGSGSMVYDLATAGASDKIVVSAGTLTAANGSLNFTDFAFNVVGPLTEGGQYTLIDTVGTNITPLLDTTPGNLKGLIMPAWEGVLSTNDGGTNLIMSVSSVPEPGALGLLGAAAVGMLARRRRNRR